jgi:hypothetical protein
MALIYSKLDHEIHWDDPSMFLKVEESYWDLNEFLCTRNDLDAHMAEIQWYMAVWQKMNELLDLYTKNPRNYNPETDKEIM